MNKLYQFQVIFQFFFKQSLAVKRLRLFMVFALMPVLVLILAKIIELTSLKETVSAAHFFIDLITFYIGIFIPILALFFASSIVNEEIESRTFVFLTTSPVPKPIILAAKFTAYCSMGLLLIGSCLLVSFFVLNINHLQQAIYGKEIIMFVIASCLALLTYGAFFLLIGVRFMRSLYFGIFYVFMIQPMMYYFPGFTQKLTLSFYINSLVPNAITKSDFFSFLLTRQTPTPASVSIIILLLIMGISLGLSTYIFNTKEYIITDND
jgi:ABC-type transport system involved in multi-copper enzyme maturation permease subunit